MSSSTRTTVSLLILLMVCVSMRVHAAIDSAGVLDNVTARYQATASSWSGGITAAATRLFWSLALISMVWTFGMMAFRKADIGEFFGEMIRFVVFTGLFFYLLTNAPAIATSIMQSLKTLGGEAAGVAGLTPSGVVDVGFAIFSQVLSNSSVWEPIDTAIGVLVALLILGMLALVAINMVVLLVSGWIMAYAGIFFLGFGGARWTSEIAINYYKSVLGVAASLMGMTLLVGIGQAVITDYYSQMRGSDATIRDLAVVLVVAGLLLHLVNKIPPLISGIITGASVGGASSMGGAGTGTLMAAAAMAGAAAAGGVAAMASAGGSAAGWGSAIRAAMQAGSASTGTDTGVGAMPSMAGAGSDQSSDGDSGGSGTTTPLGAAMGDGPGIGATTQRQSGEQGGKSMLGALGSGIAAVAKGKAGSVIDAASHKISQTTGGRVAAEIRSPGTAAADRQNRADINQSQTTAGKARAARAFMATGMSTGGAPPAFTGDSLSAFNNPETSKDADAEVSAFANRKST